MASFVEAPRGAEPVGPTPRMRCAHLRQGYGGQAAQRTRRISLNICPSPLAQNFSSLNFRSVTSPVSRSL